MIGVETMEEADDVENIEEATDVENIEDADDVEALLEELAVMEEEDAVCFQVPSQGALP